MESIDQVLVVLDGMKSLPQENDFQPLLKSRSTHIILISYSSQQPDKLRKEIDQQLIRGWSPITIQPLSTVHTTQRIVHCIMSQIHFTPLNREQKLLEGIAGLTSGCPGLINVTNIVLQHCITEAGDRYSSSVDTDFLSQFASKVPLLTKGWSTLTDTPPSPSFSSSLMFPEVSVRAGSFKTDNYLAELIDALNLPPAHEFVLRILSIFAPLPIPLSLTDIIQRLVIRATQGSTGPGRGVPNSIANLLSAKLLRPYPSPVIRPPTNSSSPSSSSTVKPHSLHKQEKYLFVPQLVQDTLWEHMDDTDVVFTITTAYKALQELIHRPNLTDCDYYFATGLTEALIGKCDTNRHCIDDTVYKEAYKMLVSLQLRTSATL